MVAENQEKSFISAVYRIVEQTLNILFQVTFFLIELC